MISVTDLSSLLYCARKLYLNKVLKIYEPIKEALVRGTIRHETYEEINKIEEQLVKSITKDNFKLTSEKYKLTYSEILKNAIKNNRNKLLMFNLPPSEIFKQTWPLILKESVTRSQNILNFIGKHKIFENELWKKLTPKIKSEVRIENEELQLRGIVDQIAVYEDQVVPFELKTGSMPKEGIWPGHKIQLQAYMTLIKHKGKNIKEGFIRYLDHEQDRQISFNPFVEEEVMRAIKKGLEVLNSNTPPEICENTNKCENCGLKVECHGLNKQNI
ncbi:CRISPR-associated protein Cas4 [Nanoarchaeota archaeon]